MARHLAPDLDIAMGLAIRLRRQAQGRSQAELGGAIGVSFQQMQKYERGVNRVSFSTLMHIAEALGCQLGDLVADLERIQGGPRPEHGGMAQPEAPALLRALTEIKSPARRTALLDFTRALSRELQADK